MAAIAFDPLEYTHELEAVGVPREQAEIHARAMTDRFIHNFDALVTTDYLDSRLSGAEGRVDKRFAESEARVDKRFAESEAKMEKRFAESEAKMEKRFAESEAKTDKRFAQVDMQFTALEARLNVKIDALSADMAVRFERMDGKFSRIYLMFGLTMVTATIPILQNFFGA